MVPTGLRRHLNRVDHEPFAAAMLEVVEKGKNVLDGPMSFLALVKDVGEKFGLSCHSLVLTKAIVPNVWFVVVSNAGVRHD
jgi:hypothetical protein